MHLTDDPIIRNVIHQVHNTFVYGHPTLVGLAEAICSLLQPTGDKEQKQPVHEIREMIDDFSVGMSMIEAPRDTLKPKKRTVLVTGTTGALGSQLLVLCLAEPQVDRVYAFNRPSSDSATATRQEHTFLERGLDVSLLNSPKLMYLEGDASEPWLGLNHETYEDVRNQVTTIIHNSWRLDFNLSLSSFTANVRGTRSLLDFALTSPNARHIRFLFTSSTAVSSSWPAKRGSFPEEPIMKPDIAVGSGYGESKYVSEQVGVSLCLCYFFTLTRFSVARQSCRSRLASNLRPHRPNFRWTRKWRVGND